MLVVPHPIRTAGRWGYREWGDPGHRRNDGLFSLDSVKVNL